MDGVTEKYSVFDFFNLIIGGVIFFVGLGICNHSQLAEIFTKIDILVGDSDFAIIFIIIFFVGCSLVIGTVINEFAHLLFCTMLQSEKKIIKACLNKGQLIHNDVKLEIFRDKAKKYLKADIDGLDKNFSDEQCSTFFAYCVYYLHVRGQDKKNEKLREAKGLSELLTLVFVSIPVLSIIIYHLSGAASLIDKFVLSCYFVFIIFSCAFFRRSKRATENRIRIVLAIYDACVDMEQGKECFSHSFSQNK